MTRATKATKAKPRPKAKAPAKPKPKASPKPPEMYGEPDRFLPLLDDEPRGSGEVITVETKVWRWKQTGKWYFATVPKAQAALIRSRFPAAKRGWGSVPVRIKVGDTEWETSLFPEKKTGSFLFAIKADVRKAESIDEGSAITAQISARK